MIPDPATPEGVEPARRSSREARSTGTGALHPLNPLLSGFACIRCAARLPIGDYFEGCPTCLAQGHPSTVRPEFRDWPESLADRRSRGMQRYAASMPYSSWVTLGEGGTSCVAFPALAAEMRSAAVYIKNEGQNPSGSHKDRASCLTVTRALDAGATNIIAASSGNGGASLALYAAAAGLGCAIVTTPALSAVHRRAIAMTGAEIVTAPESLERWRIVADRVGEGWFPATNYLNPPVGSNAFGIPGLKTVAFEMFEELGDDSVDAILVPTSRGDLVWGLYEGFRQLEAMGLLKSVPRLFAVEPFARISRVLDGDAMTGSFPGTTSLVSIGGSTVTYQAVEAVRASGGGAVVVDDGAVERDQLRLARHGCYAELSSAAALTGLGQLLRQGRLTAGDRVALLVTSNGYKEPAGGEAA